MTSIFKGLIRGGVVLGVLAGLGLGGMWLVAGKERTAVMLHEAQLGLQQAIDHNIDDPAVLRHQLESFRDELPERISSVRKDIAELSGDIRDLRRERDVANEVVEVTMEEYDVLAPLVSDALGAGGMNATEPASFGGSGVATMVRYNGKLLRPELAALQLERLEATRVAYTNRAADAEHDLGYLEHQHSQLEQVLSELLSEQAEVEADLAHLDREIDALARGERLAEMLKKRQRSIEEYSRYETRDLQSFKDKLDDLRREQLAELDVLTSIETQVDYEEIARMRLEAKQRELAPVQTLGTGQLIGSGN